MSQNVSKFAKTQVFEQCIYQTIGATIVGQSLVQEHGVLLIAERNFSIYLTTSNRQQYGTMGLHFLVSSDYFMNRIETLYQTSIASMSPRDKVAKSIGLFNWSRDFISREVRKSNPGVSLERLKLLVALRMYGSELKTRKTIEGLLANIPD